MGKLCLLLFWVCIFKATGQSGTLDSTFGINGIQTTAFFSNANTLFEGGNAVLTDAIGNIFVVIRVNNDNSRLVNYHNSRIARYLPDGRLDSSYGYAGYSSAVDLDATSAAFQEDKILVCGDAGKSPYYDFALARYTADGTLDSSFGVNGRLTTDFNNSGDGANAITVQGEKILIAGYTYRYSNNKTNFAIARYTANGALDSSFGVDGKIVTDFDNSYNQANAITLLGDKILVAGYTGDYPNYDFALARYTADGVLDSSFGEHGKVTTDFNNSGDFANSLALMGNKIILAGYTGYSPNYDFALARYTANGVLDSSFGVNGRVTTDFNDSYDEANSITLQGDKIIVAGPTYNPGIGNDGFALARYTAYGILDASFGMSGKVTTYFNSSYQGTTAITLQGDKIIMCGDAHNSVNNNQDFALVRYTADGALDSSFGDFGGHGLLTGHFPTIQTSFTSTALQGNKIIAAGYALNYYNSDFALARYTTAGTFDSSFGVNGKVTTDFNNSNDHANAIVLQGDKILVAGATGDYPHADFALARYTTDGVLDSSFGVSGLVTTNFEVIIGYGGNDGANSIVLQGDKIIVAGYANNNTYFALARYTANGMLDSSFGINGIVTTDFDSFYSYANASAIALQGDKIIVAGSAQFQTNNFHSDFALARYTADGILDSSFGEHGRQTTSFNHITNIATSLVLQGDKIIVAGSTDDAGVDFAGDFKNFALVRYTADGILDSSFGEHGKVITDFNNSDDGANSIALQGDKIIAAGSTDVSIDFPVIARDFALARYTADGILDSSFGMNGKVITDFNGDALIEDIALRENRLYVVGSLTIDTINTYGIVAAYQLDTPAPTISIADVTVQESKKQAVVTVSLSAPATLPGSVSYTTQDKTAIDPQDYLGGKDTLLFNPGVATANITIPIIDDSGYENNEQFAVLLTSSWNAAIKDSVAVVTIMDDDTLVTGDDSSFHISVSPNPSNGAFAVQVQGHDYNQPLIVRVFDMSGRLIEQRTDTTLGQRFRLGARYLAGSYIIEARQGSQRTHTKVIKAKN
ncbi:Calx-beta domain-containing protein [Segetibacter koreensis]|uniref:Calx-beta domain-containing protein n=1 Tax=Segetibacter koreensis TaxID=398037 RepID=UPI000381AD8B|nr:Calx-beta domain-containing protein [Segetibacter koreensis]